METKPSKESDSTQLPTTAERIETERIEMGTRPGNPMGTYSLDELDPNHVPPILSNTSTTKMTQDEWNQFCNGMNQVMVNPILIQANCNVILLMLLGFGWTVFLINKLGLGGFPFGIVSSAGVIILYLGCKTKAFMVEYTKVKEALEHQCLVESTRKSGLSFCMVEKNVVGKEKGYDGQSQHGTFLYLEISLVDGSAAMSSVTTAVQISLTTDLKLLV